MAKIPLSQVVGQFLDIYSYGPSEYAKAYRIAIRGWRQLNWDVTGKLTTCKLPVENDLTVCLPDDHIKLVSIGIVNCNGELATLTENPRLLDLDSDDYFIGSNTVYDDWVHGEDWRSFGRDASVGVGSETVIGEYALDEDGGRIVLSPWFCYSEVTIQYNAHQKVKGEYVINELASEALLAYIRWQWSLGQRSVGVGEREQNRRDYYNELRLAKARIKKPMLQVMKQIARSATYQGVKA